MLCLIIQIKVVDLIRLVIVKKMLPNTAPNTGHSNGSNNPENTNQVIPKKKRNTKGLKYANKIMVEKSVFDLLKRFQEDYIEKCYYALSKVYAKVCCSNNSFLLINIAWFWQYQ
jgi:hypothetical protein